MTVYNYDFTGADTADGTGVPNPVGTAAWEVISGSWRRLVNKPSTSTLLASNPILAITIGTGSVDETATVSGGGGDCLYARVTNATNWIRARVSCWTTSIQTYHPSTYQLYHPVSTYVQQGYTQPGAYYGSGWVYNGYQSGSNASANTTSYSSILNGIYKTRYTFLAVNSYSVSPPLCRVNVSVQNVLQYSDTWVDTSYYRDDSYYTTEDNSYNTTDYTLHYQILLEKSVAGVITALSTSAEVAEPTSLRLLAVGSSLKVYLNNISTELLSAVEPAFSTINKHGIGRGESENNVQGLDNFVIDGLNYPPSAVALNPANGVGVAYSTLTVFNWVFSDITPSVPQAAYQIVVERNDTGALVWDSGKVLNAPSTASQNISSSLKNVELRWKAQVWDAENLTNGYSAYAVFTLADGPAIAITSPTTVVSSSPTLDWSYTPSGSREQLSFRVTYTKQGNNLPSYDSGLILSSLKTYTPTRAVFGNNETFIISLTVSDTLNVSTTATIIQLALYATPNPIGSCTVDSTLYSREGFVLIAWPTGTIDLEFYSWRVYRRASPFVGPFELVAEKKFANISNCQDWLVPANSTYQYYIAQVANRFNSQVESPIPAILSASTVTDSEYWLIDPLESNNNLSLIIKTDNFTNEVEQASYTIVGRGRHVDYGDDLGVSGSITAQLRDNNYGTAHDKLVTIKLLQTQRRMCYLRNPFGDIIPVAMGNLSIDRLAGVGTSEFCDVTIPYLEVA